MIQPAQSAKDHLFFQIRQQLIMGYGAFMCHFGQVGHIRVVIAGDLNQPLVFGLRVTVCVSVSV
jgi:hypothetical protein